MYPGGQISYLDVSRWQSCWKWLIAENYKKGPEIVQICNKCWKLQEIATYCKVLVKVAKWLLKLQKFVENCLNMLKIDKFNKNFVCVKIYTILLKFARYHKKLLYNAENYWNLLKNAIYFRKGFKLPKTAIISENC